MGLSQDLHDIMLLRQIDLLRYAEGEGDQLQYMLISLFDDLVLQIEQRHPTLYAGSYSNRRTQLNTLVSLLSQSIGPTYGDIGEKLAKDLGAVYSSEWTAMSEGLMQRSGLPFIAGIPTAEIIDSAIRTSLIEGRPMSDWLNRQSGMTSRRIQQQIRISFLAGEGPDILTRRIRGRFARWEPLMMEDGSSVMRPIYTGGVLAESTRNARAIARTGIMTLAAEARRTSFLSSPVVKGLVHYSTLDSHTTDVCIAYDGESWDYEDADRKKVPRLPGPPPSIAPQLPSGPQWDKAMPAGQQLASEIQKIRNEANRLHPTDYHSSRAYLEKKAREAYESWAETFMFGFAQDSYAMGELADRMRNLTKGAGSLDAAGFDMAAEFLYRMFGSDVDLPAFIARSGGDPSYDPRQWMVKLNSQQEGWDLGKSIVHELMHWFEHTYYHDVGVVNRRYLLSRVEGPSHELEGYPGMKGWDFFYEEYMGRDYGDAWSTELMSVATEYLAHPTTGWIMVEAEPELIDHLLKMFDVIRRKGR